MFKDLWKKLFAVGSVGLVMGCASMQPEPKKNGDGFRSPADSINLLLSEDG